MSQDILLITFPFYLFLATNEGVLMSYLQILYCPVKDLNGIPGSKSLHICLTGYQRQERDDIMVILVCFFPFDDLAVRQACH